MKRKAFFLLFALTFLCLNNSLNAEDAAQSADAGTTPPPLQAILKPTLEGSSIEGYAQFADGLGGVRVYINVSKVPNPGKHGIHIHETASCDDKGNAAGGHFNPHKSPHGFLPNDGREKAHEGDMGNIEIDEDGNGTLEIVLPGVSSHDFHGKSIILHEKEDDFGQPTGNAGGRIACGVIE